MKLLSLDTSTKQTGWAIFENGKYIKCGCINKGKITDSKERLVEMMNGIKELFYSEKPDFCVIETQVIIRNPKTLRVLTMLTGAVFFMCMANCTTFEQLSPSEWRKIIQPVGRPRKRQELKEWSIKKCVELFGIEVNDDEADAVLIGEAFSRCYNAGDIKKCNYI